MIHIICPICRSETVSGHENDIPFCAFCFDKQLKSSKNDQNGGAKHDQEKIRLDLLSSRWISGVGQVLTFGAKKYSAHNWRKGIHQSRLLGAALRHIFAFLSGEDRDPETGLSHIFHASCCLMFASELHETRPDLDDRYKVTLHHPDNRMHSPDCNFKPCPGGMECLNRVFDNTPQEKINSDT